MCQYAVIDLEMCKIFNKEFRKQFGRSKELIQIGAILLDESFKVKGTFMTYVKPEYGYIDGYISTLTGIKPKDVIRAPLAKEALEQFIKWLPKDTRIVSWSKNDLYQIRTELSGKHIDIPKFQILFETWIDSQEMFGNRMDPGRCYKLSEALNLSGILYQDGEHDALVDARNTAMLFEKMETEPIFQASPYLTAETEPCVTNPFASLLQGIAVA